MKILSRAPLLSFVLLMSFFSCNRGARVQNMVRSDLFSMGYGLSENQIDLSAGGAGAIDIAMREGIFHILDGTGKKVMKLSSYGDILALLYDPTRSPEPRIAKPRKGSEQDASFGEASSTGRYAVPHSFAAPRKIAVDSAQTIYLADRIRDPAARIFDEQSKSYVDRIVRRFGEGGEELSYLGQEGPGGSPFPQIAALEALSDDSIAVISSSETAFLVHRFTGGGMLLSNLRIGRDSLPIPGSLALNAEENEGLRLHASLEDIFAVSDGESFEIALKIDYYRERFDPESLVIAATEFVGSWIFVMDGANGRGVGAIPIAAAGADESIPELIGISGGYYYLLSPAESREIGMAATGSAGGIEERMLQIVDGDGKVHYRYSIDLPEDSREVAALKVSPAGQIYAFLISKTAANIVWWDYR